MTLNLFVMKLSQTISTIIIIHICTFSQYAYADLVSKDLIAQGDKLIVWDTVANLEWLYLDATVGRSIESLVIGAGGVDYLGQHGFRFANQDELQSLWAAEHVPLSTAGLTTNLVYVAGVTKLIQILGTPSPLYSGSTIVGESLSGVYNVNSISCGEGFHQTAGLSRVDAGIWAGAVSSNAYSSCFNSDHTGESKGKYLVREGPNNTFPWEIFMPGIMYRKTKD